MYVFDAQWFCAVQQSHIVIQVPYVAPNEKWTMLALDLAELLASVTKASFEEVKRVQFCANMAVRGAFTADFAYSWKVRLQLSQDAVSHVQALQLWICLMAHIVVS